MTSIGKDSSLNLSYMRDFFRKMSQDQVQKYLAMPDANIFHATVDNTTATYVPAGYLFAERTANADNIGFRIGVVCKDPCVSARLAPLCNSGTHRTRMPIFWRP